MTTARSVLRTRDVMTPDPVCVSPSTTVRELARVFEEHEISGAPVIDGTGRIVGVVSKSDLIRRCSESTDDIPPAYLFEVLSNRSPAERDAIIPEPLVCVGDFMTDVPVTVRPETPVGVAARLMVERGVHRVIVLDDDRCPVGIMTTMDVLRVFDA